MLILRGMWELANPCPHGDLFLPWWWRSLPHCLLKSFRLLFTCSSVFRSPNSSKKAVSEGNCDGSRKLSRLKSSSTEFCKGVPVSSTLCSCMNSQHGMNRVWTTETAGFGEKMMPGHSGLYWWQFCFARWWYFIINIGKRQRLVITHVTRQNKCDNINKQINLPFTSLSPGAISR